MSEPKFLTRLRVVDNEIVDLAGNIIVNNGVTISDTGIVGDKCLNFVFDKFISWPNGFIETLDAEDFTFSCWTDITNIRSNSTWKIWNALTIEGYKPRTKSYYCAVATWQGNIGFAYNENVYDISTTTSVVGFGRCHVAICRQGNTCYIFCNGSLIAKNDNYFNNSSFDRTDMRVAFPTISEWLPHAGIIGTVDDLCLIKGIALWTNDFVPPTSYLSLDKTIYLSSNQVYGVSNNGFGKLADDYTVLTNAEKTAMFDNIKGVPTIKQLENLTMPIRVINYSVADKPKTLNLVAVPKAQTITPKSRIPLIQYSKLNAVNITSTISGNGQVKIAVTKDNKIYKVWDSISEDFIDIDLNDIYVLGMTPLEVASLSWTQWQKLECLETGIGFAYYLSIESTTDIANTDELSLNVEFMGELASCVKGRDFDYSYITNDILQVKIYKSGDFKINYNPGQFVE